MTDVSGKKILILTASPVRDQPIDEMLSQHLTKLGNQVFIRPCLREGRDAVLEVQPDVVVVPPIRNFYSRDFVEQLKKWNCGVVTRHTEASCDWQDFKAMNDRQKATIMGTLPYQVDLEIVWGEDEAQILRNRRCAFPVFSVGSFAADEFLNPDYITRYKNREAFNQKHGLDNAKKTILIQSPWGFADSAPDLGIDEMRNAAKDIEGRDRHIRMIELLHESYKSMYNFVVTIHPGVDEKPYKEFTDRLKIKLDITTCSIELLMNCDILIHAGSTMAMGAHFLNIPAFQYGDVNLKDCDNWWSASGKVMSELSPQLEDIRILDKVEIKDNINPESLKKLEVGRYGLMDGKATERAAEMINKVNGKFKYCWPDAVRDYTQLDLMKSIDQIAQPMTCGICKKPFYILRQDWIANFTKNTGGTYKPGDKMCPNCGTRLLVG